MITNLKELIRLCKDEVHDREYHAHMQMLSHQNGMRYPNGLMITASMNLTGIMLSHTAMRSLDPTSLLRE